jgi:hypothetical protein
VLQRYAYVFSGALVQLVSLACAPAATLSAESGSCVLDSNITCNTDFNGFTCTGTARPDQNAEFRVGAIQGTVCTSLGLVDTSTGGSYCCTSTTTACGYDPGMDCPATASSGYACTPPSRPENFDPDLACGMGQEVNGETIFCCGIATTPNCAPDTAVRCNGPELVALECMTDEVPNEGELGTDQSRSDATLLCDVPAMIGGTYGYCCFTPTQAPVGASCLQDQAVPNCPSGSFGFACTGPDTPDQDYSRITCPTGGGVRGTSAEGYPSSLYCCTYLTADGGLL